MKSMAALAVLLLATSAWARTKPSGWFDWSMTADASSPIMSPNDMKQATGCENVVCECEPTQDLVEVRRIVRSTIKCQDPVIEHIIPRVQSYVEGNGYSAVMMGMTGTGKTFLAETLAQALFSHDGVTGYVH